MAKTERHPAPAPEHEMTTLRPRWAYLVAASVGAVGWVTISQLTHRREVDHLPAAVEGGRAAQGPRTGVM